ncbi:MAG TPA: SDR family NAD(P)-dependent oxidoreductase, partial [Pseudonocardia sp.]|nr:SDR family NAD(P)-dependent oxidoreductase [Pseudonocardia sp.]
VDLCHAFLPGMVERDGGAVSNVSSLGGYQPEPYLAVYAATKAFTLSFSRSLAGEVAGTGVQVQALCPGPVTTGFFDDLGTTERAVGQTLTTEQVVARSLRALERHRPVVIPGWRNALAAQASRFLPRQLITAVAKRAVGPGQHAQQAARPSVDERRSG